MEKPWICWRPFNCLGCLFVRTVGCFRFGTKMEVNMHWRITVEAVDPTGEEYRKGVVAQINCGSERALREAEFRRCVQNWGGRARSFG